MDMDGDNKRFGQPVTAECAGCQESYPETDLKQWKLTAISGQAFIDLCPECYVEWSRNRREYGW